eukprot:sb/3465569/
MFDEAAFLVKERSDKKLVKALNVGLKRKSPELRSALIRDVMARDPMGDVDVKVCSYLAGPSIPTLYTSLAEGIKRKPRPHKLTNNEKQLLNSPALVNCQNLDKEAYKNLMETLKASVSPDDYGFLFHVFVDMSKESEEEDCLSDDEDLWRLLPVVDVTFPIQMSGNWKEDIDSMKKNPRIKTTRQAVNVFNSIVLQYQGVEQQKIFAYFEKNIIDEAVLEGADYFPTLLVHQAIPYNFSRKWYRNDALWYARDLFISELSYNALHTLPFTKETRLVLGKEENKHPGYNPPEFCGVAIKVKFTVEDWEKLPKINISHDAISQRDIAFCISHENSPSLISYVSAILLNKEGEYPLACTYDSFANVQFYQRLRTLRLYWPACSRAMAYGS